MSCWTGVTIVRRRRRRWLLCAAAVIVYAGATMLAYVPSSSMEPTVHAHSIIFGWRLPYAVGDPEPKRGEIVIFKDEEERGVLMIKRVVGVAGDTIDIKEGHVFVNGEKIDEEYLPEGTVTNVGNESHWEVPEGHCFVMGDNRCSSFDSRYRTHPYIPYSSLRALLIR